MRAIMKQSTILRLFAALLLANLAACGNSNPDLCKISGKLTFQGKPIPQVFLRFEPTPLADKSTSMAVTDANGKFEMFIGSTPGVFRGKVIVFCDDPLAAMGAKTQVPADIETAYRALCEKYGNGKSKYELTIDKSDSNLELKLE
jgi:hypothetical protein